MDALDLPPLPAAKGDLRRRQERSVAVVAILGAATLALVIVALTMRHQPTPAERPMERQASSVEAGAGGGGGAGGDEAGATGVPSAKSVGALQASASPTVPQQAQVEPAPQPATAAPQAPPPPTFGFTVPAEEPKAPPPDAAVPTKTTAPVPPSPGAGPATDAGNGGAPAGTGGGQGGGSGTGTGAGNGAGEGNGQGAGTQPDPQFMGLRANGRHVVYVIDRSGSMMGGRFSDTIRQLRASIEGLPSEATFYVIFFSSPMPMPGHEKGFVMMPGGVRVRATKTNKAKAINWISTVTPMGGTDPTEALREALKLKPDTIFLMTDGEFHSPDAVESLLDRENRTRKVSIFTIAFHDRSQEALLKRIAANHKGEYRFVAPGTTP